jgi:hypothetical protein
MSVSVKYYGRCGNNIFQYVTARIFAEKNNLPILTPLNCDILNEKKNSSIIGNTNKTVYINNSSFINDEILFNGNEYEYVFDDYFQNCRYINKNSELVKNFFTLPEYEKNTNDIVLSIRLDDKIHCGNISDPENWDSAEIIHPDYYKTILESESYNKVYIVVDKIKYEWEKKYMSNFDKYKPIIISQTPYEDFHFMRKFNKIITSVSTYSYWSAFLSDAEKIYTFKNSGFFGRPMRSHGNHVVDLWNIRNKSIVIDEKFYFGE